MKARNAHADKYGSRVRGTDRFGRHTRYVRRDSRKRAARRKDARFRTPMRSIMTRVPKFVSDPMPWQPSRYQK